MIQRADSARDGTSFHITPMLLTTLTAAVLSTVFLVILWYVDANTPPPPPPTPSGPPPPPPAPGRAVVALAAGTFGIAWVSVIAVACRDQILRRIDQIADRVAAATVDFAEQREEDGVFRGMRIAAREPDTTSEPGGHVLPFPRSSPPAGTPDD